MAPPPHAAAPPISQRRKVGPPVSDRQQSVQPEGLPQRSSTALPVGMLSLSLTSTAASGQYGSSVGTSAPLMQSSRLSSSRSSVGPPPSVNASSLKPPEEHWSTSRGVGGGAPSYTAGYHPEIASGGSGGVIAAPPATMRRPAVAHQTAAGPLVFDFPVGASTELNAAFDKMDMNGDGVLTRDEVRLHDAVASTANVFYVQFAAHYGNNVCGVDLTNPTIFDL